MVVNRRRLIFTDVLDQDTDEVEERAEIDMPEEPLHGLEPRLVIPMDGVYYPATVVHGKKLDTRIDLQSTFYEPYELAPFGPAYEISGSIPADQVQNPSLTQEAFDRFRFEGIIPREAAYLMAYGQALMEMCRKGQELVAEIGGTHYSLTHIRQMKFQPPRADPIMDMVRYLKPEEQINWDATTDHFVKYTAACQGYVRRLHEQTRLRSDY